jgi:hypothetical protein
VDSLEVVLWMAPVGNRSLVDKLIQIDPDLHIQIYIPRILPLYLTSSCLPHCMHILYAHTVCTYCMHILYAHAGSAHHCPPLPTWE